MTSQDYTGEDCGAILDVTSAGQVRYTTPVDNDGTDEYLMKFGVIEL